MLSVHPDVRVVAEFDNGESLIEALPELEVDAIFLDVQMPGISGLEVAKHLHSTDAPAIVFTTAYDRYALNAFEVRAFDFLLKPFSPERLSTTLEHIRAGRDQPRSQAPDTAELAELWRELRTHERRRDRLTIRTGDRIYLQDVREIDWIEADGRYVKIHLGDKNLAMRETMQNLEEELDPARFVRVSRSAIVNLDRVKEIQPWFAGEHILILQNGAKVTTTRTYRDRLRELID